jgi:hypothetical protein
LPFRSPHLRRFDGIATRIGWQPTSIHLEFIALLRAEGAPAGTQPRPSSRSPTGKARRRAAGTRVKIRTGVRKAAPHVR